MTQRPAATSQHPARTGYYWTTSSELARHMRAEAWMGNDQQPSPPALPPPFLMTDWITYLLWMGGS
jgi:hypothetical protein